MALLEEWHKIAYNDKADQGELQRFWQHYFLLEKGVYEKLLANPDEAVEGTVKELAEKYELSIMEMTGFLDGINDSLVTPNPIEEMDEDTKVRKSAEMTHVHAVRARNIKNVAEKMHKVLYRLEK